MLRERSGLGGLLLGLGVCSRKLISLLCLFVS